MQTNKPRPRFTAKSIAAVIVFLVGDIVAQLSMALHWPAWVVWALLPFIAVSGIALIMPALKAAKQHSQALRSGRSMGGTRFSRVIGNPTIVSPIIAKWAETYGYKLHSTSTPSKSIYLRVPFGMMPIFVALETSDAVAKIEAWIVSPGGREEGLTSGFSVRIPNWIGVSNVNKLLTKLSQAPIGPLKG